MGPYYKGGILHGLYPYNPKAMHCFTSHLLTYTRTFHYYATHKIVCSALSHSKNILIYSQMSLTHVYQELSAPPSQSMFTKYGSKICKIHF